MRVVVLGAGYAGLMAFLELQTAAKQLGELTLVNQSDRHVFTTELPGFVAGEEDEEDITVPLRRVVRPPARLVVQSVERIDPSTQTVHLKKGRLPYDHLIVALGSQPEYYNLEGVAEHSVVVQNLRQAEEARRRLARIAQDKPDARVVIAGGGLTGIELCGDITDRYPDLRVTVIEGGPEIMAGFDANLVAFAKELLRQRDVHVVVNHRIQRVSDCTCELDDGAEIRYDLLIWAGGVRGNHVLERSGLDVTPRGRGLVDSALHARGHPNIYLAGDCAAAIDRRTRREYPPTAQVAVRAGRHAASNLKRRLAGKVEQPFRPELRGMVASIGRSQGVAQIGQEQLRGIPAMWLKKWIEAHHAYDAGGMLQLMRHLVHYGFGRVTPASRRPLHRSSSMRAIGEERLRV